MQMIIKVVVIDDNKDQRTILNYFIQKYPEFKIISEFEHGTKAFEAIKQLKPDVIFVDIDLPGMNGIEIVKTLKKKKYQPLIIFYTSYPQYAVVGFDEEAIDYLVKPITEERLKKSLTRIRKFMKMKQEKPSEDYVQQISYYIDKHPFSTNVDDIIFLHIHCKKIYICLVDNLRYIRYRSLKKIEYLLNPQKFIRVNRQYIINKDKIKKRFTDNNRTLWLIMKNLK
jgi:DNA-binding LytR/AlgR family response regulator